MCSWYMCSNVQEVSGRITLESSLAILSHILSVEVEAKTFHRDRYPTLRKADLKIAA
jgi:hypothetical protein